MEDTASRNLAIVKTSYDAFKRGDWDGFFAPFAEDCITRDPVSLPYGGEYRGIAGVRRLAERMLEAWDESSFDILNFTAGDDLVIVHFEMAIKKNRTGRSASYPVLEMWRLKDEKVVELRVFYWDTHHVLQVFGA